MEELSTPLRVTLDRLGAHFTPFAGWSMPLRFTSDKEEHTAVRETCAIFDLSHMAQIEVAGPAAPDVLDYALCTRPSAMTIGKARYSLILTEEGGILDDLIIYRLAHDRFLVVANAANRLVVLDELTRRSRVAGEVQVSISDTTLHRALVALQGPRSLEVLHDAIAEASEEDCERVSTMGYYTILELTWGEIPLRIARTGYTGERGYEIMLPASAAELFYQRCLKVGEEYGLRPAGLAARDTLRLEAGMCLYGNELDTSVSPKDVGLEGLVGSHECVGAKRLAERPHMWELIGLAGEGRRAARSGSRLYMGDEEIGVVTSGLLSPTLNHPIALARVRLGIEIGQEVEADVRGTRLTMRRVPLPFYSRTRTSR